MPPTMTDATRLKRLRGRFRLAADDPITFLRWFVWTLDQHDKLHPVKRFPAERPQIVPVTRLWQANPLLSIRKSRQVVMTWLFAALSLWDAMFHRGRLVMLQSKRLEDAVGNEASGDGPLGRAKFILHHIPGLRLLGIEEGRDYRITETRIEFPAINSAVWAIPQGANIIRQRTASGILSDESHFQEEFADAYAAALPCIRGGGWFVSLSTAHPGAANDLHDDNLGSR